MTLILESDCTLVFTVLLLLVEGLKVCGAWFRHSRRARNRLPRCRAARRVTAEIVLWLTVVGLSTWNVEHLDGMDGLRANVGSHLWTGIGII